MGIFAGWTLLHHNVFPRMNTVTTHDQFTPMRQKCIGNYDVVWSLCCFPSEKPQIQFWWNNKITFRSPVMSTGQCYKRSFGATQVQTTFHPHPTSKSFDWQHSLKWASNLCVGWQSDYFQYVSIGKWWVIATITGENLQSDQTINSQATDEFVWGWR